MKPAVRKLLSAIAAKELNIETLETRGRDCLDFHDVSVWGVAEALCQAYKAGEAAARKRFEGRPYQLFTNLLSAVDDLIAAIDGNTDQFEPEVRRLQEAVTKAEQVLKGGVQ
jgi:hypothetical protein